MEPLIIEKKNYTPGVEFNPAQNTFKIFGKSRPEDISAFYEPIKNWIESFVMEHGRNAQSNAQPPFIFDFEFEYFNSSSSKMIYEILKKVKELKSFGYQVIINWYYSEDDEDIMDSGGELSLLLKMPFNFIRTSEE